MTICTHENNDKRYKLNDISLFISTKDELNDVNEIKFLIEMNDEKNKLSEFLTKDQTYTEKVKQNKFISENNDKDSFSITKRNINFCYFIKRLKVGVTNINPKNS